MATKVHMEALSPTMEEGQVVKWLKTEGSGVTNGEIIAEIETDKATMELTARGDGVLRTILVAEGGTAPVGEVIALIGTADEDISALQAAALAASTVNGAGQGQGAPSGAEVAEGTGAAAPQASEATGPAVVAADPDGGVGGRIKASPLARRRRLAAESGVALAGMSGSGPAGRIVKRDVESAILAGPAAVGTPAMGTPAVGTPAPAPTPAEATSPTPPAALPATPALVPSGAEFDDVPLSQMRKTIARRLTESIGPRPPTSS